MGCIPRIMRSLTGGPDLFMTSPIAGKQVGAESQDHGGYLRPQRRPCSARRIPSSMPTTTNGDPDLGQRREVRQALHCLMSRNSVRPLTLRATSPRCRPNPGIIQPSPSPLIDQIKIVTSRLSPVEPRQWISLSWGAPGQCATKRALVACRI